LTSSDQAGDPAARFTLADARERSLKRRDAWWTIFLVDPLAIRLAVFAANRTSITPNHLTVLALLVGMGAAWLFWQATTTTLIVGALAYHFSFMLDCMDGKIARLKGTGSLFGTWLDWMFDRIRVFIVSVGLFVGQFRETDQPYYLYLAALVIFLDMFRYIDAMMLNKLRGMMRSQIVAAKREMRLVVSPEDLADNPEDDDDFSRSPAEHVTVKSELQREFKSRFPWYLRIRDKLQSWRVRPHLFSGIEFQMFIFILGPVSGLIGPFTVVSTGLLILFESVLLYKMHLSLRDMDRLVQEIRSGQFGHVRRQASRDEPDTDRRQAH
jgi:phosphatidylglycerophosphate synthase